MSPGRLPGPLLVVLLLPVWVVLLPAPAVVMALELTRMSLAPWRWRGRYLMRKNRVYTVLG